MPIRGRGPGAGTPRPNPTGAFDILIRELEAHGAPERIVQGAHRAAQDEVRHAEVMGDLARRLGGIPNAPEVEARPLRSLFEIALDNACEGCVRETYGALTGHVQALRAVDPEIRRAMAMVAEDETRHAELSWEIHQWILPQLSEGERAEIAAAHRGAVAALRREVVGPVDPTIGRVAGLPTPNQASIMVD